MIICSTIAAFNADPRRGLDPQLCRFARDSPERWHGAQLGDEGALYGTRHASCRERLTPLVELAPSSIRRGDLVVSLVDRGEHLRDSR
jgi:hypothetical protein